MFKYLPVHDVLEVNEADFGMCRTINPISSHNDGETVVQLTEAGTRYFICGRGGFCTLGVKLRVDVTPSPASDEGEGRHRPPAPIPPRPPSNEPPQPPPSTLPPGSPTPTPSLAAAADVGLWRAICLMFCLYSSMHVV